MELTADNVFQIVTECLIQDTDKRLAPIRVKGVRLKAAFHPDRLNSRKADIISMLECLPDVFKKSGGGGMTFLNMCVDKNGIQWANLHETMDQFLLLGLAIGKLSFLLPRDMWKVLPEGMPYIIIND